MAPLGTVLRRLDQQHFLIRLTVPSRILERHGDEARRPLRVKRQAHLADGLYCVTYMQWGLFDALPAETEDSCTSRSTSGPGA
jgi:hypothetical protein